MKITLDKSDIDAAIVAHLAAMGLSGFTEIEWSRYSSPDFVTLSKPEAIDVEPPFPPPPSVSDAALADDKPYAA